MDLESEGDSAVAPSVKSVELTALTKGMEEKLETLRGQYENQLENLRSEIDRSRKRRSSKEDDGSGGSEAEQQQTPYSEQVKESLREKLAGEQKDQLETLVSSMDNQHQEQLEDMHRQHVDDVEDQVKAMRSTLEEIYKSQLELMKSELEQSHQISVVDLQETLVKEHKEELNKLQQECNDKIEELKQEQEIELKGKQLDDVLGKEDSAEFITNLNKRLTEEHRNIIQKIEADLESQQLMRTRASKDSQTDSVDDAESVASVPVTKAEYKHLQEKHGVLKSAEDVQKSLDAQVEEISSLRAQMLGEYEQMLSVRAEVMASQSEEVEKLQQEMTRIQQQYEAQMSEFQDRVTLQTETSVRSELESAHTRELEEMKTFYESKVSDMEKSYTTDIAQLKQEHADLLSRLQQESGATSPVMPSSPIHSTSPGKQREYVRRTTMLTAISDEDEDESPPSTPTDRNAALEGRIKALESKLKDKEKIIDEINKRLEAETTSAEDLHGKLLDSNKTLEDFEESLKAKSDEIDELKKELTSRDNRIIQLEKAALEEKGEKDTSSDESGDNKIIKELEDKIQNLEEELSASKEVNKKIKEELNQMDTQHGEAIMKLKEEMENLNKIKLDELEAGFQIQLEEELDQQAEELDKKSKEELNQQAKELEIYKQTESELKQKLDSIQTEHEKQLSDLRDKIGKQDAEVDEQVKRTVEAQLTSPLGSMDKDSLEAAIREDVKTEILQDYEESVDKLKSEYEERISDLNNKLQTFETQGHEKATEEKETSDTDEAAMKEKLRAELALEFKEKLQKVTDEYESKLKRLQDIVDGKKEEVVKPQSPPYVLARSRSLDRMPEQDRSKLPQEYEGFVSTIRREYEDRINSLQKEIAQYKSTVGPVPLAPLMPLSPKAQLLVGQSVQKSSPVKALPDSGTATKPELGSVELRQEIYDEIAAEFETSFKGLSANYEKQLEELNAKLSNLQTDSAITGDVENRIRAEVAEEYEEKIEQLKQEYEAKITELEKCHEEEISKLTAELGNAKAERISAEQKVKADMFVWHEEIVTQLKRKHEESISQYRKEFEEKMELYKEEVQEEFDGEKKKVEQGHKRELLDWEERYDSLVEGVRSGEAPEVAEIVQEKYDMELEMARTLIQQECDETIESEQSRLSEEYDQQIQEIIDKKDKELAEQKAYYEKIIAEKDQEIAEQQAKHETELEELRTSLLQQYEAQIIELESKHQAEILQVKIEFEAMLKGEKEDISRTVKSEESVESSKTDDSEKDEEQEKVTSSDSTGDRSDKDDDDKDDGKGGSKTSTHTADSTGPGGDESGQSKTSTKSADETDSAGGKEVTETVEKEVVEEIQAVKKASLTETGVVKQEDSELVQSLRQQLEDKVHEYETTISQLRAAHEEEVRQLTEELSSVEADYVARLADLEEKHELDVKQYEESIQKLRDGVEDAGDTEAMEEAHQQELQDLEDRLVQKHMNELNNLATQHQSKLDDMQQKYSTQIQELQQQLSETQRAMEQYPDIMSPSQIVPSFHGESSMGSTKESTEDFMVRTGASQTESVMSEPISAPQQEPEPKSESEPLPDGTTETQAFSARTNEDITESSTEKGGNLQSTLDELEIQSLTDTSMDKSRGTLRGVDDTIDTELIHFSEEDSDKSMEEGTETQKTDRSTPPPMLQTLEYGTDMPGGPTVKSLDDTTDSSIRVSEREDLGARVKELEAEVEDLRARLQVELSKQDDAMERLDREKQEERNLVAMLREDIEQRNTDREGLQNTNEHLLGLLSDAVKTYMSVEESITKKMKVMMEKAEKGQGQTGSVGQGRPGSAERKKTSPTPGKKSPSVSPGRLSPARADDPENLQETSILSNVTDEGLDLSTRIADSIFQGPDLASEEEELLVDSGSRLRSSVSHLLDMIEESTSQLIENRTTQADMVDTIEDKGQERDQLISRCGDLEERLKEEVERKDFLALELHKAEGLIEGYASERETLDQKIHDLEEQKETLVLDLETTKNKLHDLESIKSENDVIRKEMRDQQDLMSHNVGEEAQASRAQASEIVPPVEDKALILEVSRLNSENREREEQIKQVHDRYESRVRELETSGEDMEHHYGKLLDDKKQEVADLKLHVEALEKQMKAKKQFIEEQSAEREQEHEDYQRELENWKKHVHDLEKQNGAGSRLQREIDDLTEQLQTRIDLHNKALLESEKSQRETQDKELSIKELQSIIQQLEQDLQDRSQELETTKQKLKKVEEELSRRPFPDDDLTDSSKSGSQSLKSATSLDYDQGAEGRVERGTPQMTVEEEMRQAAKKTKEELVREKFTLQTQVNDHLVQISSLRTQLDDMRYRRGVPGLDDTPDTARRLEMEREKSEDKDQQISELKLHIEELGEKIENRDQQIEQLHEQRDRGKLTRGSPIEAIEFEHDKEIEKQIQSLQRENKQLKERVKLAEVSSTTDMSGLSQNLIDEKNQEIDHLSEQILRLQNDFSDLKAEKGVENLYDEFEILREDLKQKDRELADVQNVRGSAAFTDHSLTPDSSLMNVGASFSEKASIQQEMQDSVATNLERVANLETELSAMKSTLQLKEEQITSLEEELSTLKEDLQSKDEQIETLEKKQDTEDEDLLQAMIQEKEGMISQLTVEVDSLHAEVIDLSDFQTKLQEDYETVQNMLEEKYREIESLTKELTDKSPGQSDEHALVIKHEVEIARLKKDLREKDNVIDEKMEEIAEMTDKIELLESHINNYKDQVEEYDEQILSKEKTIKTLRKGLDHATLTPDEKDQEIEKLRKEIETIALGRPPSPPRSEDEKSVIIEKQKSEIETKKYEIEAKVSEIQALKVQVEAVTLGRPPSPPSDEDGTINVVQRLRTEIEKLKQQILDANLSEDDKFVLIRDLRLENETLRKQIDAALKIRPPSPPMDDDEKSEMIREQKKEISTLKIQVESALKIRPPSPPKSEDEQSEVIRKQEKQIVKLQKQVEIRPPSPPKSEDEKSEVIRKQEKQIVKLQKQVEAALQIAPPPPPVSEDEKDRTIEEKEMEVLKLKEELDRVTESIENGDQQKIVKEKTEETIQLKEELKEVKQKLESQSFSSSASLQETVEIKEQELKEKEKKLEEAEETVKKLQDELESVKEVKAYEDEIEIQEKQDEIEELQAELERYRSREESSLGQSIDLEMSSGGTSESKQLERSMSFFKEQYEEKCSETRQLQVQLDLVKEQLERARSDNLEDAQEEMELYKADLERKSQTEVKDLKVEIEKVEKERQTEVKDLKVQIEKVEKEKEELKKELNVDKDQLGETADDRVATLEKELVLTKDELTRERQDNVQVINDMEKLRDRKETERRGSVKTIQDLETDLEEKVEKEKELHSQVKQLSEELILIKRQYGHEDKSSGSEGSRSSPKSVELRSEGSFELATDVDTLQQQVLQFKQHADKSKEVLAEKQKYQSQLVKLEIQYEQLQKTMKKEISRLEDQLKTFASQPDPDVWTQLHATQERLEKTTEQLTKTADRLNETESSLKRVSLDLQAKDELMRDLQKDLWKTSGQLSVTSGKLQETEEKLRLSLGQVAEREEQIHQLQGELQHTQQEAEQRSKSASPTSTPLEEVEHLHHQLESSRTELEAVKTSLNEAVNMSEQQLHLVENKDQEYVKLKLDIQQTISEKDKLIREQKQKLKEKDQEVKSKEKEAAKVKEELKQREKTVADKAEATSSLASLRAQLQNQEEVILTLESDLIEARTTVQDQEQEIAHIHQQNEQTHKDEADTVEAMHNQIAELQREVEALRSVTKGQGQSSAQGHPDQRSGSGSGDGLRELSPYDQNGRHVPPVDLARVEEVKRRSPTDGADFRNSPDQSRSHDQRRKSPDQSRRSPDDTGRPHDDSRRSSGHAAGQTVVEQGRSFIDEQEDSGHQSFEPSGRVRSPDFSPEGQSLSPRQLRPHVVQQVQGQADLISRSEASQSYRAPQSTSPPTRDRAEDQVSQRSGSEGQRSSSSRRSSPTDGDEGQGHMRSPRSQGERNGQGTSFTLDSERLVYDPRSPAVHDSNDQYVDEDGQLYERDGNIRPRYSQSSEGQIRGSQSAPDSRAFRDQEGHSHGGREPIPARSPHRDIHHEMPEGQGHGESSPRSLRGLEGQGDVEGHGMSSEAERYIQQLRRELLITKTALMQIQRGERLDHEGQGDVDGHADLDSEISRSQAVTMETQPRFDEGHADMRYVTAPSHRADVSYEPIMDEQDMNQLRRKLEKTQEELDLFKTSSNLSARDFVQKVMHLKDELSNEHQRHIQEMATRAHQDTEMQLATMRIKYTDEIDHIKRLHVKELEEKLRDLQQKLDRKHKGETNRLVLRHQEEVGALKSQAGLDFDESSVQDRHQRQRQEGVGADHGLTNGHGAGGAEPMSAKLQGILRRLHNEGVQVLTISELELLNRRQSQGELPRDADLESMKAGWENERQSMISTIQSLKDLLAQTHKLRGLDKEDDDDDDESTLEGSDWRAELLRAIGYVFTKERDTLLAELRSHVLSHPAAGMDEIQRLEQKIRTMESHHHSAQDQIFNADRQSMLAEIRDLRAHATIARMHQQEDRDRCNEKVANTEDTALKKERQLKRQDSDETLGSEYQELPTEPEPVDFISAGVQLLEFKIQQEKVLQDDLRTSLDMERNRSSDLSGQLNHEKSSNLDLISTVTSLQGQASKLREGLEREQSRYVSVTNALEDEKSKSLNLSDLLESERQTLWRTQAELETLKQQQGYADPRALEQLQTELSSERELRCQAESQHEIDTVTVQNLKQEVEMGRRRQQAVETELTAKVSQLQRAMDNERQKQTEITRALDRERSLSNHLQQSLEVEKSQSERQNGQDQVALEDLMLQLETERANLDDLNTALQREQNAKDEVESEKSLLKDHLVQERTVNEELKQELDKIQFERLEAVNKLQKERDAVTRMKSERDQINEELRALKSHEIQRNHDRETERLSTKKTMRDAGREKEEYRMKLHEQELETQRLSQKMRGLQDQLAESQENELRAIRDLEQIKLDMHAPDSNGGEMVSVQTSPRRDMADEASMHESSVRENREQYNVYRSQLESMCQSLHYLILRCREQLNKASHSSSTRPVDSGDFDALQKSLRDLLGEVKQLQEMEGDFMSHPSSSVNERILRQNEELTNFVARISEEKTELRLTLTQLEEEIWRYRQMDAKYHAMQRSNDVVDHQFVAEKAEWAKEKLSLQMALNSAEREIGLLQTDLRVERERRVATGNTETKDTDKIKIQRLYGKYLRAESFRKALIYQKKYLLLLLGGYQDTEETTLALLSRMGATEAHRHRNSPRRTRRELLTSFRGAVRVVIAIQRMKYLVNKWRRATRVGSEVVGGTVDQTNGFSTATYSPPRHGSSPRVMPAHVRSVSSPPPRTTNSGAIITSSHRVPSPSRIPFMSSVSDTASFTSPRFDIDAYSSSSYQSQPRATTLTHVPSTPPTKDYNSSTTKYTSPSTGARRKILTSASIPAPRSSRVRFTAADEAASNGIGDTDDYIHRLENLQTRLGTLQNGKKGSWRNPWR